MILKSTGRAKAIAALIGQPMIATIREAPEAIAVGSTGVRYATQADDNLTTNSYLKSKKNTGEDAKRKTAPSYPLLYTKTQKKERTEYKKIEGGKRANVHD